MLTRSLSTPLQRISAAGMAIFLSLAILETIFPSIQVPLVNLLLAALSLLSFLIHEAGHPIFGLLGFFIGALGGTLAQVLFPLGVGCLAFWQKRPITAMFFAFWLGRGLTEISTYIGDARSQSLPLFSPQSAFGGPEPIHDWHYLLGTLGLLPFDHWIAGGVYGLGVLIMAFALAYCCLKAFGLGKENFIKPDASLF
jgi:hypothetical protein